MKRMISASYGEGPDVEYNVTLGFSGFVGYETQLIIDARVGADAEELLYIVQEDYADDLLSAEVIDFDSDMYDVEVTFDGQMGATEVYFIWANSEDEAIEDAIEEAKDDLEIIEFHEL